MLLASGRNGVSVQMRRLLVLDVESLGRQCSELEDSFVLLHLLQLIMYTMFFVLHVNWFLMVYLLPVVLLVKHCVHDQL